jgi:hypothetical protein
MAEKKRLVVMMVRKMSCHRAPWERKTEHRRHGERLVGEDWSCCLCLGRLRYSLSVSLNRLAKSLGDERLIFIIRCE